MNLEKRLKNIEKKEIYLSKYGIDSLVLVYDEKMKVLVNDKGIVNNTIVQGNEKITVYFNKKAPSRNLDLKISKNKLEARGTIKYIDSINSYINEKYQDGVLILEVIDGEMEKAELFKEEDIIKILKDNKINYGIIRENINLLLKGQEDIELAKGIEPIGDEEDKVVLSIQEKVRLEDERIDYRNKNKISMIKKNDVIATIVRGKEGSNGRDIYGNQILKKNKKKLEVKCIEGCYLKDDKILGSIDGKVEHKNNTFTVRKVLEVNKNIDMESGNINFIGNLYIKGDVGIGMTVSSGESLILKGNGESCTLISRKEAKFEGSILASNILVGIKDKNILKYIENLMELKEYITGIKEYSRQLLESGAKEEFGKMVKLIMEKKFIGINKLIFSILSYKNKNENFLELIKLKFVGLGPLNLKSNEELEKINIIINNEINKIKEEIEDNTTLAVDYVQDCKISCSGDIVFTGKGEYISHIVSEGNVMFLKDDSIARGGHIKAEKSIACKIVGSSGGAKTILQVNEKGIITCDIVYRNTVVQFGNKTKVIEEDSKNLKAFLENGEIQVEKLIL